MQFLKIILFVPNSPLVYISRLFVKITLLTIYNCVLCDRVSMCVLSFQSCSTLRLHRLYSPSGSSVHGIHQARILEWVAIFFSRRSSWPRGGTWVSCTAGGFFTNLQMTNLQSDLGGFLLIFQRPITFWRLPSPNEQITLWNFVYCSLQIARRKLG